MANSLANPRQLASIRQFQPDDGDAVRRLYRRTHLAAAQSGLDDAQFREFSAFIDASLADDLGDVAGSYLRRPGSDFWVAEQDGDIVGCVGVYRHDDGDVELRRLVVDPAIQRQGLASRLMAQAEAFCRAAGYPRLMLWTSSHTTAAIAFYEGRGYARVVDAMPPYSLTLTLYQYAIAF